MNKSGLMCILEIIDFLQKIMPREVTITQFHAKFRSFGRDNYSHRWLCIHNSTAFMKQQYETPYYWATKKTTQLLRVFSK